MTQDLQRHSTFNCWNCERSFSLLIDLSGAPQLSLECPFCSAACHVDLDPYRDPTSAVLRGGEEAEPHADATGYRLPDLIPTRDNHRDDDNE